jgi:hypothetical protein
MFDFLLGVPVNGMALIQSNVRLAQPRHAPSCPSNTHPALPFQLYFAKNPPFIGKLKNLGVSRLNLRVQRFNIWMQKLNL